MGQHKEHWHVGSQQRQVGQIKACYVTWPAIEVRGKCLAHFNFKTLTALPMFEGRMILKY